MLSGAENNGNVHRRPGRSAGTKFLDAMSNVWLGIILAALLFVYCSIGSAISSVRQHPWLEMTEFEWFHWWPFNVLNLLFGGVLILATIRRIPLRLINAGVWTIHTGIILLCTGSYWYFTTKVEGDAPVFRRLVTISMPGMNAPASMVAVPGSHKSVTVGPDNWHFEVQGTNTDWPILSEEDNGKTAYAVSVRVQPPTGEPFVRQLLGGYPQYTEDVVPGQGRAIKAIGRKLVREDLQLGLDYHPTTHFHVMNTWALYVRKLGDTAWHQRPLDGMPRYNDRITSRDQVFSDPHFPPAIRPMDRNVPASGADDPLAEASVHITGYLKYAHEKRRWREGGPLNPVVELSLVSNQVAPRQYELIAFDAQRNRTADGNMQLLWLPDRSEVASLPTDSRALLKIAVPEINVNVEIPITQDRIGGDFLPLGEGAFAFRISAVHDNLALPNQTRPVSIASVEFRTPEGTFRRWVASVPELTKDLEGESNDPHAMSPRAPDPRIVATYQPQSPPVILAAYPGGLHFVFNGPQGRILGRDVVKGETVPLFEDLSLRVSEYLTHAVAEVKPEIVPPPRQQARMNETFAMARVEVQTRKGVEAKWLKFARYVFPDAQYAMGGRFAYAPVVFETDDGPVEVVFSRRRMALPHPIAMEDFRLDTHLGGFTGSALTIRNYISRLRFLDNGSWTEPVDIAVNNPTEYGGFWYFQSEWDGPVPSQPGGGMNFTGLGIGNRHGVYLQLLGCCVSVAGMIFAFYVKPVMQRRRAEASRSKLNAAVEGADAPALERSEHLEMEPV
jgi:hypothetical protein